MKQFKLLFLNAGLIFGAVAVTSCSSRVSEERVVKHEREVDTDDNIFTGSTTVEEKDEITTQNRRTGAKTDRTVTTKKKYDRNGTLIQDSQEFDSDAAR